MSERKRLSEFARSTVSDSGLYLETRSETGRGSMFGSAQQVNLDAEETRELYEQLRTHFEDNDIEATVAADEILKAALEGIEYKHSTTQPYADDRYRTETIVLDFFKSGDDLAAEIADDEFIQNALPDDEVDDD